MNGIFVRALELPARIGVRPDEAQRTQPLRLDIDVTYPGVALAGDTGRLRDTLDYRGVAHTAEQVVARGHFRLVETLAVEIARALLQRTQAEQVRVRLLKLDCLPRSSGAGVEVALGRDAIIREPKPVAAAQLTSDIPLAIIGGGAAGLAAALWCWRLGHPALLIDPAERLGGQLQLVHFRMPDLPAMSPTSGHALRQELMRQFVAHRGQWLRARLLRVVPANEGELQLGLHDEGPAGEPLQLRPRAVILATGVRRRALGIPNEDEFVGKGLLETASSGVRHLAGQRVAVIGGGDAACENALKLARVGAQVTLLHRRRQLSASHRFRKHVHSHPRVTLRPESDVVRLEGADRLEALLLSDGSRLQTNWALVRVGWLPNNEALPTDWLDSRGFVCCDTSLRVAGLNQVFVAGDLRGPAAPSFASAAGDGACAAKSATALLERDLPD